MIHTQPSDTGFGCVSRRRAFSIFVRREDGCFIDDPQILYDRLCEKLRCKQLQIPSLVWADEAAVQSEMLAVAKGTGRSEGEVCTPTMERNLKGYLAEMDEKHPTEPKELQAFVLSQNPCVCFKASKAGVLPAFTATDKFMHMRNAGRHLLAIEKFSGHGFPVTEQLAKAMKTAVLWYVFQFFTANPFVSSTRASRQKFQAFTF